MELVERGNIKVQTKDNNWLKFNNLTEARKYFAELDRNNIVYRKDDIPPWEKTYRIRDDISSEEKEILSIFLKRVGLTIEQVRENKLDLVETLKDIPGDIHDIIDNYDEEELKKLFDCGKKYDFVIWSPIRRGIKPDSDVSLINGYFGDPYPDREYFKTWKMNTYTQLELFRTTALRVYYDMPPDKRLFNYKKLVESIYKDSYDDPYMYKHVKTLIKVKSEKEAMETIKAVIFETMIENKKLIKDMIEIVKQIVIEESTD